MSNTFLTIGICTGAAALEVQQIRQTRQGALPDQDLIVDNPHLNHPSGSSFAQGVVAVGPSLRLSGGSSPEHYEQSAELTKKQILAGLENGLLKDITAQPQNCVVILKGYNKWAETLQRALSVPKGQIVKDPFSSKPQELADKLQERAKSQFLEEIKGQPANNISQILKRYDGNAIIIQKALLVPKGQIVKDLFTSWWEKKLPAPSRRAPPPPPPPPPSVARDAPSMHASESEHNETEEHEREREQEEGGGQRLDSPRPTAPAAEPSADASLEVRNIELRDAPAMQASESEHNQTEEEEQEEEEERLDSPRPTAPALAPAAKEDVSEQRVPDPSLDSPAFTIFATTSQKKPSQDVILTANVKYTDPSGAGNSVEKFGWKASFKEWKTVATQFWREQGNNKAISFSDESRQRLESATKKLAGSRGQAAKCQNWFEAALDAKRVPVEKVKQKVRSWLRTTWWIKSGASQETGCQSRISRSEMQSRLRIIQEFMETETGSGIVSPANVNPTADGTTVESQSVSSPPAVRPPSPPRAPLVDGFTFKVLNKIKQKAPKYQLESTHSGIQLEYTEDTLIFDRWCLVAISLKKQSQELFFSQNEGRIRRVSDSDATRREFESDASQHLANGRSHSFCDVDSGRAAVKAQQGFQNDAKTTLWSAIQTLGSTTQALEDERNAGQNTKQPDTSHDFCEKRAHLLREWLNAAIRRDLPNWNGRIKILNNVIKQTIATAPPTMPPPAPPTVPPPAPPPLPGWRWWRWR